MEEIERRYLCVSPMPDHLLSRADRVQVIRQGYLTAEGPSIRVRQKNDVFLMTVKSGQGLVRTEVEWPVPEDVAHQLFKVAEDLLITKTRYVVGRWEIDVFDGALQGLTVVEVELESATEPLPAVPAGMPELVEVTEEPAMTNRWLAGLTDGEAREFVEALATSIPSAVAWANASLFDGGDPSDP